MKLENIYIEQDYDRYAADDHEVWSTLCKRQLDSLKDKACRQFFEGLERTALDLARVPHLDVNAGRIV